MLEKTRKGGRQEIENDISDHARFGTSYHFPVGCTSWIVDFSWYDGELRMYDDVAVNDHEKGWINFLVQLAQHRYGIMPDKIIGISSNTAILHNDEEVVEKLALSFPLFSTMPVDTLPLPTLMIQTGVDQPICFVYNEMQLAAMMN